MRESSQAGSVLIFIIVAMTIVAIMGTAIMSLTSSSTFSGLFINNRHKAYYLAQAGRNYATMTILNAYNSADIAVITALNGQIFTLPDGNKFYLTTKKESAGITTVESTGIANPGTALETKQKIVFTVRDPTVINGAASVGTFTLNSDSFIDGYDSSDGADALYHIDDRAKNLAIVQTNSLAAGTVTLNRGIIYGKAYCGMGCVADPCDSAGGIFVCYSGSVINLGTFAAEKNNPTPVLELPIGGTNILIAGSESSTPFPPIDIGSDGTVTKLRARNGSGGLDLTVNNSTINIYGDVTLIVDGSLTFINASNIVIQPNSTLVLWINTKLEAGGISKLNVDALGNAGAPPNLLIKGIEMTRLNFVKDSRTYCSIYAPGAEVNVDNTSEVFGSFYAKDINMNGGKLHCDMAFSETKGTFGGY